MERKSLQKLALEGKIKDPFSGKFDPTSWRNAISKDDLVGEERNLVEAAIYFSGLNSTLIGKLSDTIYNISHPLSIIDNLIAYTNSQVMFLQRDLFEPGWKDKKYYSGSSPRLVDHPNNHTGDDFHTGIVDALQLPVQFQFSRLRKGADGPSVDVERRDDIARIVSLSSAWVISRHAWQKCLFEGFEITQTGNEVSLRSRNDDAYFTLARHREQYESMSRYGRALADTSYAMRRHPKPTTKRDGLDVVGHPSQKAKNFSFLDPFIEHFAFPTVIDEETGLTLQNLAEAWELLSDIADQTIGRLSAYSRAKKSTHDGLLDQLGRYSKSSLVKSLQDGLKLPEAIAHSALSRLTYDGAGNFDPWATPLIESPQETVSLLLGVLSWGNRGYVIKRALNNTSAQFPELGWKFDQYVYQQLSSALKHCPYAAITKLFPPLKVRSPAVEEEIDGILLVGRDLYVLENKMCMFPSEPREEWFHSQKILEASRQLDRKICIIRENAKHLGRLHSSLSTIPEPQNVRGIVVANLMGPRQQWTNHFLSDPLSLGEYFGSGSLTPMVEISKQDGVVPQKAPIPYYNSFATLKDNLPKYLEYSPHGRIFEDFLESKMVRRDFGDLDEIGFSVQAHEVILPSHAEELFKRAGSLLENFARHLWKSGHANTPP